MSTDSATSIGPKPDDIRNTPQRAEQAREEIEEQWKAAFESNPTMYFIVDGAGAIVTVNPFGAAQLGYAVSELIGQPVLGVFYEPDRQPVQEHANACFEQPGRLMTWEARKVRKDDTMLWVRESAKAVLLKNRPLLLVVCEDITEQKRAEEAARRSEKKLREVVETIPVIAFSTRADGLVEFINQRWVEYSGEPPEQPLGSGWQSTVHPDDVERAANRWLASLASGEPLENELRHRSANGEYRWFLVRAVPLRDEQGNILKWYGTLTDIEDRKRAEQALRSSEAYLAEAQRLSHTGSWAIHPNTREPFYLSDELIRMCGYDPQDGLPSREQIFERIHAEDRDRVKDISNQAFREKTDFDYEFRLTLPDGTVKHIHATVHFALNAAGEIAEVVGTDVDITESKRAQEALQRSEAYLARERDRLQLLLNLTNQITSNLELREVLRAIAANIRVVMQCDVAAITLPGEEPGTVRVYAVDFPGGKGAVKEELVISPGPNDPGRRSFETQQPLVVSVGDKYPVTPGRTLAIAEGISCGCFIPLVSRGRALGTLALGRASEYSFTEEDVEFLSQVSGQIAIAVENALAYREISELKDRLAQEKLYLEEEIRSENFENIVGNSPALMHVLELVETVAPSDSTVLLLGETGTGKELIARAIHDRSRRKERTFVKLNCAAIPTGLLESELFGHERGAFTGAISQKAGRMELADQGTLFLDEVGDIPIEIQPKLLRALQEREFERLGSTHTRKVNVRLVAATNRDLERMIADREFRSDLYYRLNVFPIRIPPLRERREDIPLLASYFVQKCAKQMQKKIEGIPTAVIKGLSAWEWPGNIRELENFIERAVILTRGKSLEAPLAELRKLKTDEPNLTAVPHDQENVVRIVEETINALNRKKGVDDDYAKQQREEIVRALTESKGRVGGIDGAAARMGLNRTTLLARMKRFGIDPRQYA